MGVRNVQVKKKEEALKEVQEIEITLGLLNQKLNFLISKLVELEKKIG